MTIQVTYQAETSIIPKQFISVLSKSSLRERCPLYSYYVIQSMLDNADLLITA